MRIAIIGAGPAGLVAALAGKQLGMDVRIFEQAADFRRVGGGLMLHRNGLQVLEAIGLIDTLQSDIRATQQLMLLSADGRELSRSDLRELPGPNNEAAVILRGRLQERLWSAAQRTGVPVEFGRRLTGIHRTTAGAVMHFANDDSEETDVIVAADGMHSIGRESTGLPYQQMEVGEAYLRGVACRGTRNEAVREFWSNDGRRFGICPLPGEETYFFCTAPRGQWHSMVKRPLDPWIDSWADFGPEVLDLLHAVTDWSQVNYSELHEIRMARWHRPPVFLVGDAAHAMTPNLGQGANQAMVDSLVLMKLLQKADRPGELAQVAQRHETIRIRFATKIQKTARRIGQLAQLRSRPARLVRNKLLALGSVLPFARRSFLHAMAGYHPAEQSYLTDDRPIATLSPPDHPREAEEGRTRRCGAKASDDS